MRWVYTSLPPAEVEALSKRAGVSLVLAELLLRGGRGDIADQFLRPLLAGLGDPFLLHGVEPAVARLEQAIARREKVMVLGDYDVDGVTSTALFVTVMRGFGVVPKFVVP